MNLKKNLGLIPRTHMVEGGDLLPQVVIHPVKSFSSLIQKF